MNSLTYLTRRCPRKCDYCNLRNAEGIGKELTPSQWIEAFSILDKLGVQFNLILGNETWLLGYDLIKIMEQNIVPYALYTTCPPNLFMKYAGDFFSSGIDNLSCGIDYPFNIAYKQTKNEMEQKSTSGWLGLLLTKSYYPEVDCQATVTVHRQNYEYLPDIVKDCHKSGIFCGINFLHWNKDGKYDFFPERRELDNWIFKYPADYKRLGKILNQIRKHRNTIQNIQMLDRPIVDMVDMGWHCNGDPYGGPTIDADGTLRLCGYRKGNLTSRFTIFDLKHKIMFDKWKRAVKIDSMDCPGCFWSYPWMYRYWQKEDPEFGRKVFVSHAGHHIPEKSWSKRRIS